jgi:lactoylglutathione lyase
MGDRVRQLRVVVEAEDFEEAAAFYRDELGLDVELDLPVEDGEHAGAHVLILQAGRATLELSNPAQVSMIDAVEVGRRASPHIRVAFEVDDTEAVTTRLAGAGAEVIAPPTRTPWDSVNSRLSGPAGLQLTLFQEERPVETSWNGLLLDQLEFQWETGLRPRLEGLSDEEYLWEPGPDVMTIAWRIHHLAEMFAERSASHVGRDPVADEGYPLEPRAVDGVRHLDEEHATWVEGVRARGEDGLLRPCGPAEGPFAADPFAALVLHLNRELLHHGAEICLLRDLYAARGS